MNSSKRSPILDIPREVREQEGEIEAIFRDLMRFDDGTASSYLQDRPDDKSKQEVAAWIVVAVLGVANAISFYLLWLKTNGG
ncbi:MAG TPA: hypothetical protein VGM27_17645 [Acidobacteriaceae bacterium]